MKTRTITAIGYVAVIILLLVLKWAFPVYGSIGYDALFWLISVCGAYEFLRAVKEVSKAQWWTTMITCALIIPTFVATKMIVAARAGEVEAANMSLMMLLAVGSLGCMVTASLLVFNFHISSLKSTAYSLMCILYCGILGSVGAHINHLATNSLVAVMLMFFITAGVDTFALLVGMSLGKVLPLKLAPHTSPNKTVVGAIGGILGGIIAASVAYGCCALIPGVELTFNGKLHPWVLLILISLPTSIFSQLGDLFESAIKRGCGIKDMGKILPGHGGILDRFDSMLFAAIPIIVCFVMIN